MYVPLKITTDYSLLKSMIKIDDLINTLKLRNITSCALCDEYLYGVMEFYNKCLKNNIKPIIGLDCLFNKLHIYLYAKNYAGYQNLLKINTIKTSRELTRDDLEKYKENIMVIVPYASLDIFSEIKEIYEIVFLGYQSEEEKRTCLIKDNHLVYVKNVLSLSIETCNYLNYLKMIELDQKISDFTFIDYKSNVLDEAISGVDALTTLDFSDLISLEIPKGENHIPKYNAELTDTYTYLQNLTQKGLKKRLKDEIPREYQNRLDYELNVIKKMGFVDYILIVYDYVLYAKKNNILVGPGRGSAAGSLVCYTLGITDIDPLKYNLLFERFLNPERITMPDIDIDFENTKRYLIIDYIKERYGKDKVASIMTFATLKSKLILREVTRILDYQKKDFEELIKNISSNLSLKENLNTPEVRKLIQENKELKKIYKIALTLEGLKKNISTHAAGVVISKERLDDLIPVIYNDDLLMTGITMEYLEELGLLKMDLLAIKNLTIIMNILDLIKKDTGRSLNLNQIDLNDKEVLDLFTKADTTGIFQFESNGMRKFLQKLKPRSFSDIIAAIALFRPGPMENIDSFIKRKEKKEPVDYITKELEPILKETEGIIIYQEQVMQILSVIASYSYAEADLVRRAMSKKKKEIMLEEQTKFIKRALNNGYTKEIATKIYNLILKFASYGFNKSHSVAYSLIGYQMAYLKVKFPKYFITNLLNMSIGSEEKTADYLTEAKQHNLVLVKPSINISEDTYFIKDNKIYLPLSIIKGLNNLTITSILEERKKNGPFSDFIDFLKRTYNKNINERIIEILIKAGVFLEFNNSTTLKNNLDICLNYAELASEIDSPLILKPVLKEYENEENEIANELESYGFYISNHPASLFRQNDFIKLKLISKYFDKYIKCGVLIESIKKVNTKKGEEMAFLEASDETGRASFVIFNKQIKLIDDLKKGSIVEIQGRVVKRYDKYQINVNNLIKK